MQFSEPYILKISDSYNNLHKNMKSASVKKDELVAKLVEYVSHKKTSSVTARNRLKHRGVDEKAYHLQKYNRDILKEMRAVWRQFFLELPSIYARNPYRKYAMKLV